MSMFGLIAAGRLVQTDVAQVGETQFVFNVPEADNINHIVVFLTGTQPFPDTMGGAVHFGWQTSQGWVWQLLGHITNEKPSAIFKLANLKKDAGVSESPFSMEQNQPTHNAQIGISVEPLTQLQQQTPVAKATVSKVQTFVEFSEKMLSNLFNYVSSFAQTQAQMTPNPSETFVPISALQNWYNNFERKMQLDPYFWRS